MLSHVVPSLAKLDQAAPQLGYPTAQLIHAVKLSHASHPQSLALPYKKALKLAEFALIACLF